MMGRDKEDPIFKSSNYRLICMYITFLLRYFISQKMLCFNIGHNFKKVGLDQKLRRLQKTERSTARKRNVKCI